MFKYYKYKDKYLFSTNEYENMKIVGEDEIKNSDKTIYFLDKFNPLYSRSSFSISHPSLLFLKKEDLNFLRKNELEEANVPQWLMDKINKRNIRAVNTMYPNWEKLLFEETKDKWKLNLLALGDVGGTLLIGLRLLGSKYIDEIGIYDRHLDRMKRWEYELNQVRAPFTDEEYPKIKGIDVDELFDCDMFIFCASSGVPKLDSNVRDVRMAQFDGNAKIIKEYARMARNKNFDGIFAVVSDPVDLLCKVAFLESNTNDKGVLDFCGIPSDKIIGYGLGVMNARASFYAEGNPRASHFLKEGRVYGPHGEGLVVADSIYNYDEEISMWLTEKAKIANLEIRNFGYKPYIAPSLSSGSLSILSTLQGNWLYGSTYMGGVYMGSKFRLNKTGIEIERLKLPYSLYKRIENTYEKLGDLV